MTKAEKKMGVPKPKYDPKKKKERKSKKRGKHTHVLFIPEREPTEEELEIYKSRCHIWIFKVWKGCILGKYSSLKSAEQALECEKKKVKNGSFSMYKAEDVDRAVIEEL